MSKRVSETTRAALIHAALDMFGARGYTSTTIREIASAAGTNIASIAYHFGGKEGLRAACAERVVELMQGVVDPVLQAAADEPSTPAIAAAAARRQLLELSRRMVRFLLTEPAARPLVPFMIRELNDPSPALEQIYAGVILPVHCRLCRLWQAATGEPAESQEVRLTVFTLIGQIVYFRIGQNVVLPRMQWRNYGLAHADRIADIITRNLAARIDCRQISPKPAGANP